MKIKNKEYDRAFGENLKRLRKNKKLSRETLAAIAGIEPKQIYRIEAEYQSPTVATLVAIALALKLHPKKMLEFDFEFEE
ncbi:MAG: helix-turn-helix transcriptional regulator [Sphingobacteriia bacterium]|nr:helix-turn-helix transcriptional regulator [Sphingobacteriia bacterium]